MANAAPATQVQGDRALQQGILYAANVDEAMQDEAVIKGTLLLDSVPAVVFIQLL